ncbi:alpha/beta hydrolase [Streptococcus agalactiae]
MIKKQEQIWNTDEYNYEASYGFIPYITTYLHSDKKVRSAMLIVPGGGYRKVASGEADIVAKEFYGREFNVFVCTYTTNYFQNHPLYMQPLLDLSRAVRYIRKHSNRFYINPNQLTTLGFSAGGHLVASLGNRYGEISDVGDFSIINNRPDFLILSYPVITSGKYAHSDSFVSLLGADATQYDLEKFSVELQITENFPPSFIWHTMEDSLVPVENSLLLSLALRKMNIPHELHLFSSGDHGLSLANQQWARGDYGEIYTNKQLIKTIEYYKSIGDKEKLQSLLEQKLSIEERINRNIRLKIKPNHQVMIWPQLAQNWLHKFLEEKNED